jgi:transcriptional regulator
MQLVESRGPPAYTPIDFDRSAMATERIDLLILKALALAPLHGYGVGQRIEQMSGGVFRITLGALYPALQRLERQGLVKGDWSVSDHNRRARYYTLTPAGRRRLATGQRAWHRTTAAMLRVLGAEAE